MRFIVDDMSLLGTMLFGARYWSPVEVRFMLDWKLPPDSEDMVVALFVRDDVDDILRLDERTLLRALLFDLAGWSSPVVPFGCVCDANWLLLFALFSDASVGFGMAPPLLLELPSNTLV